MSTRPAFSFIDLCESYGGGRCFCCSAYAACSEPRHRYRDQSALPVQIAAEACA